MAVSVTTETGTFEFEDADTWTVDYETGNLILLKNKDDKEAKAQLARGFWLAVAVA